MATANTAIKITSLPNIGNNIAPSTLIPVVNMAGDPVTQKANLQITGNLILAGAGTANFVPAGLANLAYSVVNAAQPNITSTGTLNVNTLKVSGGVNGQYLQTDGTGNLAWVSGSSSGNGEVGGSNTQIQFNDAGNFGGNTGFTFVKTTGILAAPFADVSGVANIVGGGATVATKSVLNIASTFGSNSSAEPASAQAIRGRVTGANLTKTRNYVTGVTGQYLVTGTNASEFIKAGILGVVGDQTTTADGAVVAYLDGDGGLTTANAAYAVSMKNSTPNSGFNYGLDLQFINLNLGGVTTSTFKQADIRFNNGVTLVANTANNISINANVTAGNVLTSANVIANGVIESGTGFTTGGYLSVDGNTDLHNTTVTGYANVNGTANTVGGGATVVVRSILAIDSAFGSNDANDPASAQAVRGRVTGANLTKTRNYVTGVTGQYLVTGTNASEFIKAGVLGVVGDQTTTADGAVVAYLDGDGGLTTAGSAYGVSMKNSTPGSGFDYGLDLQFIDLNVAGTTTPFKQADIRFNNGVTLVANTANNISINANVTVGNIIATNIGNIATINLTGSNANVLYGNGVFAAVPAPTVAQDITSNGAMSIMLFDGNIKYNNYATVEPSSGNIAGGNISANGNISGGNISATGNITANNLGNISSINIDGSNTNVLYGNGVFAAIAGGANTGNVTFNNQIVLGTGSDDGTGGLYLAPGNASIANSAVQYLRVRGGDVVTHIHLDTGNNAFYDQYFGNDNKFVKLEAGGAGNIVIGTDDANGNSYNWSFTSDGNLILADGNSVIQSIANSSLDPVNPNVSTMVLTPDSGYSTQALVLDPTAPGHIHLRAPGANIDEPSANIFLGGETSSFEVGYYNGAAPNLFIHSGNNTWTFDNAGILTFPGTPRIDTDADNFEVQAAEAINFEANTVVNIYTDSGNNAYQWQFGDDGNLTLPDTTSVIANASITLEANDTGNITGLNLVGDFHANLYAHGNVTIVSDSSNTNATWTFGDDGLLTFPNNLVITGNTSVFGTNAALITPAPDLPLIALSSGANGAVSSLWVEDIGNVGTSNIAAVYANPTVGSGIVRIAVGQNGNAGPNLWDFGATGNLTLPTGGQIIVSGGLVSSGASPAPTINGFSITNSVGISGNGNIAGNNISATGNITSGNISTGVVTLTNGAVIKDTAGDSVSFGQNAGNASQGSQAVAIGLNAGANGQANGAVAVGVGAGQLNQGITGIAIGDSAGSSNQGLGAVAIGAAAGFDSQGQYSVAMGYYAGYTSQANNSIILNATGANLNQTTANTFTVAPVRNDVSNIAEVMFYNTTSKEVTYGNTISVAGNISGNNISATGNISGNTNGFTIGYLNIPQVAAANATLALTDAGKHYYSTTAGNFTLTVPTNANVAFATGTAVSIVVQAAGNILVNAASGVTLYMAGNSTAANRVVGGYGMATLMKVGTDTWFINGTGVS